MHLPLIASICITHVVRCEGDDIKQDIVVHSLRQDKDKFIEE